MDEHLKDKVEDAAATAVVAAVSLVPFVGGPISTILNGALGSAVQRRQERVLSELLADLERLSKERAALDVDALLLNEEFIANLSRTVRICMETFDADKRRYVRNVLLNGIDERIDDSYARFVEFYSAEVFAALQASDICSERTGRAASSMESLREYSAHPMPNLYSSIAILVGDGMMTRGEERKVREVPSRRRYSAPGSTELDVREHLYYSVSPLGKRLLEFIRDPVEPI